MKNILLITMLAFAIPVSAQEMLGKWTGSFNDQRDNKTSYVIEITNETGVLNATTTTIFKISSTSYFIICSTKVELDSAKQKITITELEIIKANTPEWFSNCLQKHILTFSTDTKNAYLKGKWEAIKQKTNFCGGEGDTFLKKRSK
jgi:hypothetical protein